MKKSSLAQIAAPTEAQRAAYVAWLLRVDPYRVFQIRPECTAEANQYLVEFVLFELEKLTEENARSRDRSPRALWFRRTLNHCNDVMSGKCKSLPLFGGGFENAAGCRRGVYVFQGSQNDR